MEIWKDVKGFEGIYQVSNKGRVKSIDRVITNRNQRSFSLKGRLLKPRVQDGYFLVMLCKGNKPKHYRIHRLVAEAFIPNPNSFPYINHIDEIKSNNNVENLEWCTRLYNNNYGHRNEKISAARRRIEQEKREKRVQE